MHRRCSVALVAAASFILMVRGGVQGAETLSLSECLERALRVAPSLEEAGAGAALGEARLREARAPLLPGLRGQLEYSQQPGYDDAITNGGTSSAQLLADYVAFDGGRRLAALRAARWAAQAAALGVGFARSQVVFDTRLAYFDLIRARQSEAELQGSASRLARYVGIVEALARSGRAIPSDVLKIQLAHNQARLLLNSALRARQRASIVLGSLIGEYGRDDLAVAEPGPIAPPAANDLANNPTLLALRRQDAAAQAEVDAAAAERYPTFSLALASGFLGNQPRVAFERHAGASYGGVLSVPIYQGGAVRARIDQARAGERQLKARIRQTEIELARRLAEAASRYREARQALELLSHSVAAADDAFALAWSRFLGGGNITLLEVLDSYRQSDQMRLAAIEQRFAARQATAESVLLVGAEP